MRIRNLVILFLVIYSSLSFSKGSECNNTMEAFFRYDTLIENIKKKARNYDHKRYGFKDTPENREKFERLFVKCMSPGPKEISDLSSKKLNNTFNLISVGTMVGGYAYSNWEEPKDMEWFLRLGIGIGFGAGASMIQDKLLKNHGHRFYNILQDYLFWRGADLVYIGGDKIMTTDQEKMQEYISKIKNQEEVEKILKILKKDNWYDNLKEKIFTSLGYLDEVNVGIGTREGIDFDHLTKEQLRNKDIQDVVIAALIRQEKERRDATFIHTGSATFDSFIFDSFYSLIKIPKDYMFNKMTTQIICLNANNPKRGYTQAVALNVFNQVLFADYFGITYRILKHETLYDDENAVERTGNGSKIR